ncbi:MULTISPECIES: 4-hydroxy-tetrahydrodipicolinate synthase [Lacticaseibacillus]|uniref:4-hydroxy-tetrahydrodipicolinate synthase n=1 Tax=Lacticaseibacillus casei DSM 20011 = JCM 1134 = ATCC 393 TaxID=1423732 RepID=A0AAD1AP11_LACCA|nr:4-hydroxy-tetrahydrodipicolinate synthase [Lacticaseibacillus casei]MBI6598611.1 4-hydroxy-tetrahydrodipicolinate synthase [Lacticaseibacillus casei]MBO1482283.1 4-hydroxy-tetrahydrodipicolinate synthase [Lacticaseibacillus casei]MBO2417569.1 4-hydroxy-tetrahydrodipicolinate synthase [Lacticaseibacillus casei]MCK2082184.1 4-hydroxy-tetrahydrodipicolinate synthase [Lacticaseibacillus casei]MDZ5494893.1 4-hydroxy-tetrahydrodipicolinate synthase [Lacticaseibacillus casei]
MQRAELITAIVTPFNDRDEIDYAVMQRLVDHLIAEGTDGFVVGATTGEGPTLSHDEKITLYTRFVDMVHGRALVIANSGSNNTRETVDFTHEVGGIAGIDATLVVVPYYNKPDQNGMIAHYTAVAANAQKPIIIYNIPGRTGVEMLPETVATLAQNPMIQGIKQCGSLAALSDIIDRTKHDAFSVWTGEDAQALTIKTLGGMGVISVASHLYAHSIREMYAALDRGDITTVAALQRQLLPKMAALFHFPSPAPTKAALNALGFNVGSPRLPILPLTAKQQQELARLLGVPELSAIEAEVLA